MSTEIPEHILYKQFDDFLDEIYGTVKIGPYEYETSRALKETDSVAYEEEFKNYIDAQVTDGQLFEGKDGEYYSEEQGC